MIASLTHYLSVLAFTPDSSSFSPFFAATPHPSLPPRLIIPKSTIFFVLCIKKLYKCKNCKKLNSAVDCVKRYVMVYFKICCTPL